MVRMLRAALVLWLCLRGTALADVLYTIEELLPLPGATIAHAHAINDSGQVVGYSYTPGPYPGYPRDGALVTPMLWDGGTALSLAEPTGNTAYNATDINNAGQIVGIGASTSPGGFYPPTEDGFLCCGSGWGNWVTLTPDSLAPLPPIGFRQCGYDVWLNGISDAGYMIGDWSSSIYSPNIDPFICNVDVLQLYESGLTLTNYGYLYDPFVDFFYDQGSPIAVNSRAWVVVPSCTGDMTGYAMFASSSGAWGQYSGSVPLPLEVSDQVAASICDLVDGPIHDKQMNASGQFILNVGDRAFLYTPCSEFPGGGSTEGCFPGPGTFPAPEPATLALIAIGLAGLGLSRRNPVPGGAP